MTEPIKLYAYWRSSASWRVRIALALKAMDYQVLPVNIAPGVSAQRSESYQNVNYMQQVPTLEHGDLRLSQSLAIIDYLDSIRPSPRLIPESPQARAHALEAAEVVNAGVQPLQNLKVLGRVKALGGDEAVWSRSVMSEGLHALERLAARHGGSFSVGETPSVADLCLIPQLYNARRFSLELEPFARLLEIERRCLQLPAFVRSRPEAQPDCPDQRN